VYIAFWKNSHCKYRVIIIVLDFPLDVTPDSLNTCTRIARKKYYFILLCCRVRKQPDLATSPLVSHEMTSDERLQKFHTDDVRVTIQGPVSRKAR